jgi:membrane associated rhomboid family serine protease
MGIYDRDYYRERRPSFALRAPSTIIGTLILINVAVFLADALLTPGAAEPPVGRADTLRTPISPDSHAIAYWLSAHNDTLTKPWMWWQLLTYGFVHDPRSLWHIFFNMLQLWFLGRTVEERYGRWEFLRIYLAMLAVGSIVWVIATALFEPRFVEFGGQQIPRHYQLLGASGAVCGVVMLFVLNFPQQTLMLFPIPIPVKAWVIGVLLIVVNIAGALRGESNVAFGVHLTGIAFAFLYFRNRWNLGSLTRLFSRGLPKRQPKLRIHDPGPEDAELSREVDRILEKITRQGEAGLTRKERRTLENASREYQKRQRG